MDYLIAFIIAFAVSFFGMIPPGLITLKLVSIRFEKSFKAAFLFALGVSFVEFFQTFATLHFSKLFANIFGENDYVKWTAVVILLVLAVSFLLKKPKEKEILNTEFIGINKKTSFLKGAFFSLLNILKYPFWIFQGIYFMKNGIIRNEWISLLVFSFGAMLGSLTMYYIYIKIGNAIVSNFKNMAKNFNIVLALFFILLALIQVFNIFY